MDKGEKGCPGPTRGKRYNN